MATVSVLAGTLAALSLLPGAAHAGDWTQVYVGASLGADAVTGEFDATTVFGDSIRGDGMGGGDIGLSLRIGADYQVNPWFVVGAFANFDWSNIETTGHVTIGADSGSAKLMKLNNAWSVGGRAGVLLTPSLLTYALIGYTRADFDDPSVTDGTTTYSLKLPTYDGIVFGVGFEHKLTNNVSLTGEYRQSRFDSAVLFSSPDVVVTGQPTLHVGRIGVAYRFGAADDAAAAPAASPAAWTGLYIGAGLGADAMTRDLALVVPLANVSAGLDGLGGGDIGGTLTVGYDHLVGGRYVLGLYGMLDLSGHETEISGSAMGQTGRIELLSLDRSWSIGARAGMLLADDVLAYGLLGYTRAKFADISFSGGGLSGGFEFPEFSGVTLGAGFEKIFSAGLSLRAEYRVALLGEENLFAIPGIAALTMDPTIHTARLLLSYRFNGGQ